MGDFGKKCPASSCQKKKLHAAQVYKKAYGKKREKNILTTRLLEKSILDDQKSPAPPPSQELNGRPLSEERKIAQKVKFARIAHD